MTSDKSAKLAKISESITDVYFFLYGWMFAIRRLHPPKSVAFRKKSIIKCKYNIYSLKESRKSRVMPSFSCPFHHQDNFGSSYSTKMFKGPIDCFGRYLKSNDLKDRIG